MKKIIIVGSTSSGKSTFARKLSRKLGYSHIELDNLFWKPNWTESTDEEFFDKIISATQEDSWVLDGNYRRTNHLTWPKADTVIWLNLPLWQTLYQNISRSLKRAILKNEIWEGTGNKESFSRMFSKDSIILWLIKTYKKNISRYNQMINDPNYSHISFHQLRSRKEIEKFLNNL